MTKRLVCGCLVAVALLSACTSTRKNLGSYLQTNELVFIGQPEALPSRITPYTSMARAAKYNSDVAVKNIAEKIYHEDNDPVEVVKGIFASDVQGDKLYSALQAMEFADIYAMSILTDNQRYIENNLYAKSAQNLSAAAIKLHRREIFSESVLGDINRLVSQQEKILQKLIKKDEQEGYLTEPEINYRKGLELVLNRLENLKSEILFDRSEYMKLIQTADKNLKLEGKRFYELDNWDKKYTFDLFADAAVENRREFTLAKEQLGSFNAAKARRKAYVDYPPVARLDINGLTIDDNRYEQALFDKAENVTLNLMEALQKYQASPSNQNLQQKAFDELCALVVTQVEVDYRLMEKASFAYEANLYQVGELKKQIKNLEKKSLSDYEKVDLLNLKVRQLRLEYENAQLLALHAAALRNLYYYAGLSPFDKNMLKEPTKEIEIVLKKSFNQDIVAMLAEAQKQEKWDDGGNAWAHQDNWLEKIIDEPDVGVSAPKPIVSEEKTPSEPIVTAEASSAPKYESEKTVAVSGGKTIIQLGAYSDLDNAYDDQKEITSALPELRSYDIYIENAVVNGVSYHRLMFKPEPENLLDLCNKIINAGYECMLR